MKQSTAQTKDEIDQQANYVELIQYYPNTQKPNFDYFHSQKVTCQFTVLLVQSIQTSMNQSYLGSYFHGFSPNLSYYKTLT